MPEPLPMPWIDRLFAKLSVVYGAPFLSKYDGFDLAVIKAEWGDSLAGYQAHNGVAISWALEHLPERPPNVIEFRALCRVAPTPTAKLLEAPKDKPNPAMLAKVSEGLEQAKPADGKAWARSMRDRDQRHLTLAQRAMWRAALEEA